MDQFLTAVGDALHSVAHWTSAWTGYGMVLATGILSGPWLWRQATGNNWFTAIFGAFGVFIVSGIVRWTWTRAQLRRIGGNMLVQFAASRGVKPRLPWAW